MHMHILCSVQYVVSYHLILNTTWVFINRQESLYISKPRPQRPSTHTHTHTPKGDTQLWWIDWHHFHLLVLSEKERERDTGAISVSFLHTHTHTHAWIKHTPNPFTSVKQLKSCTSLKYNCRILYQVLSLQNVLYDGVMIQRLNGNLNKSALVVLLNILN